MFSGIVLRTNSCLCRHTQPQNTEISEPQNTEISEPQNTEISGISAAPYTQLPSTERASAQNVPAKNKHS